MRGFWQLSLLLSICLLLFFTNLGGVRLWDRDEPRNAGCAREMMERGDWITPTFNGELRSAKPIMLYWLIGSAYAVFGVNEFAARFWSATLAIGTVLCTYRLGERLFDRQSGFWAGIITATSMMFMVAARAATPDSVLIFCMTLSLYWLHRFTNDRPSLIQTALIGASLAGGLLAKGPVGLLFPVTIFFLHRLLFLPSESAGSIRPMSKGVRGWLARRLHRFTFSRVWSEALATRILWIGSLAICLAAPWYLAVGWATEGVFLQEFFGKEHFGRATTAMENHRGNLLFYPLAILAGFFPWSIFAVPTALWAFRSRISQDSSAIGFCVVWIGVIVGVFTLAQTKLPSYITPCFPALALLTARCLTTWNVSHRSQTTHLADRASRSLASVHLNWWYGSWLALFVVGLVVCIALPSVLHRYLPGEEWLGLIGAPLMVTAGVGAWLMRKGGQPMLLPVLGASAVLFCLSLFVWATERVDRHRQFEQLLSRFATEANQPEPNKLESPPIFASYGCMESSWIYYLHQPIFELERNPALPSPADEQKWERQVAKSTFWKRNPHPDLAALARADRSPYLLMTQTEWKKLEPIWRDRLVPIVSCPYFLRNESIVILGRSRPEWAGKLESNRLR